ncbi:transmembrane 220 family protein [Maribacter sp. 2307ULW6-5]|uniref:transmembrane 220 family protein n=1 Tax=Maribacter sp. 2307ULW6-5 TaxID=3386275 RepID=UPI0039BD2685
MDLFFKFLGFLFAVLFAAGAVVQLNDQDAVVWVVIYALAAVISLLFALDRIGYVAPLLLGGACLFFGIYLYPDDFQGFGLDDGDIATVELGREAFGLLIIAAVLLIFAARIRRRSVL